jgi:hypothetical protein
VIWAILALLGVPLWLCALAILALVLRNRGLRKRPDDIPMRLRAQPDGRWRRGHGLWVHDVLAFRGSPAMWAESLLWISAATRRQLTAAEAHKFRRLDRAVAVTLMVPGGPAVDAVTSGQHLPLLLGPYSSTAAGADTSP